MNQKFRTILILIGIVMFFSGYVLIFTLERTKKIEIICSSVIVIGFILASNFGLDSIK